MKIAIISLLLLSSFVFLSEASVFTANVLAKTSEKILTIVNPRGWPILQEPVLRTSVGRSKLEQRKLAGKDITIRMKRVTDDRFGIIEDYYTETDGTIKIHTYHVAFYSISEFEYGGKIFAKKLELVIVDKSRKVRYGAIVNYVYLDRDGDGILETRHEAEDVASIQSWLLAESIGM